MAMVALAVAREGRKRRGKVREKGHADSTELLDILGQAGADRR